MKADDFRRLALALPQAIEASHMGHPDFRVGKRIFATLGHPREGWAMIKLTAEQQQALVSRKPAAFSPVPGGWGRGGSTSVRLAKADKATVKAALTSAWKNIAPKSWSARSTATARRSSTPRLPASVPAPPAPGFPTWPKPRLRHTVFEGRR